MYIKIRYQKLTSGLGWILLQKTCDCHVISPRCCHTGWDLVLAGGRFNIPAETKYSPTEERPWLSLVHWKAPGIIPWDVPNSGWQLTISHLMAFLMIGILTLLITPVSSGLNREPCLGSLISSREKPDCCRWVFKVEIYYSH